MGYRRWLTDRDHQIPSFSTSCDEKTIIFYREITDCVQTRRCRMFGWIYVWHGRLCRCILRELQERKSRFEALTNFSNGRGVEEACTETGVPSSCLSLSFSTIIYPPTFKAFNREALMWQRLDHRHILPFLGISEQVFPGALCMVAPWLAKGNALQHLTHLVENNGLSGKAYLDTIHRWVGRWYHFHISVADSLIVAAIGNRTWSPVFA